MNIAPINQNQHKQSFTGLEMLQGGARKIAQETQGDITPFVEKVIEPLKKVATNVLSNGEEVVIGHPLNKNLSYVVKDCNNFAIRPLSNNRTLQFPVQIKEFGKEPVQGVYSITYKEPVKYLLSALNGDLMYTGHFRDCVIAREIAKDLDKLAAKKAVIDLENQTYASKIADATDRLLDICK